MLTDLQKASLLKRISAFLLDFILLIILVTGLAFAMSAIFGFDSYSESLESLYSKYETEHGVSFDISLEEYEALSDEEKATYDSAYDAFLNDEEANYTYNMLISLTLLITSLSVLVAYLALEFAVPAIIGNGQTVGKKIFSLAVMRTDGVKISTLSLFIRTVLGKYTLETMVAVFIVLMLYFGSIGIVGGAVLLLILVLQVILIIVTKTNSCIHDLLSNTVVVDMASQMIFENAEERDEYIRSHSSTES
jgi:uncharacterized RDD family membrane protein YckC